MENEEIRRKVDESWKDSVEKDKQSSSGEAPKEAKEAIEVNFSLFVSGLMMEALIALGEAENPLTKKKEVNINHAKFIIDTLEMLEDKTKNNLSKDESELLKAILYELRMRFVAKSK